MIHETSPHMAVTRKKARAAVQELANTRMDMPLERWSELSSTILQALAEPATGGDLREALDPVLHWYQSDEEDERPLLDIVTDIVANLQHDRALVLAANRLHHAGANLSICAQTTGGVTGPDAGLMLAIRQWAEADEPFCADIQARAAISTTPNNPPAPSDIPASDLADVLETIDNAAPDWKDKGYKTALSEVRDMANIGREVLDRIEDNRFEGSPIEHWAPADDPAEIVTDLLNMLTDALSTFPGNPPAPSDGVLRETHWLLERRCSPPLYLRTKYDLGSQTDDVDHAARFATKREAQEALRVMPSPPHERAEFFASEHMWIDSSPVALSTTASNPPAPSVVMVGACKHERLGAMTATGYMSCVDCRWMRPMTPEEFARWNPPFEERSK